MYGGGRLSTVKSGSLKVWNKGSSAYLTFPDIIPHYHDFGRVLKQGRDSEVLKSEKVF